MADLSVGYAADGAPKTYTTIAAAFAAAGAMDNLQVWYSNAAKGRTWYNAEINDGAATTKAVGIEGMLPRRQVAFVLHSTGVNHLAYYSGNLSGITSQVVIRNLTVLCGRAGGNANGVAWNNTGAASAGLRVTNCFFALSGYAGYPIAGANEVQIDHCCFLGGYVGVYAVVPARLYYNTVYGAQYGYLLNNAASTVKNCVAAGCYADFANLTGAAVTCCASSDGTADDAGGAGNLVDQNLDDLDFWYDNDGGHYGKDFRILATSALHGAGDPVTGLAEDCDGNEHDPSTPSIGWHEGTAGAYPSGEEAASRPTVAAADDGTGTSFTLAISGDAGATHQVWRKADGAAAWTDEGTRVGDGEKQVSGLAAGLHQWVVATRNANGVGWGAPERGWVWVTSGDTSGEVEEGLLAILEASEALETALEGTGRVCFESPSQGRALPCMVCRFDGGLSPALGAEVREMLLEADVWAPTRAKTRAVEEILDEILNDLAYDTTHWNVRLLPRSAGTSRAQDLSEEGDPVFCRRLAWRAYVRPL